MYIYVHALPLISNGYDNKDIVLSCCTFLSGCYLTITVYVYLDLLCDDNLHGEKICAKRARKCLNIYNL